MMRHPILFLVTLTFLTFSSSTISSQPVFKPVTIQTEPLTMTGMRQAEAETAPRDFEFEPVNITTERLTMTGMGN